MRNGAAHVRHVERAGEQWFIEHVVDIDATRRQELRVFLALNSIAEDAAGHVVSFCVGEPRLLNERFYGVSGWREISPLARRSATSIVRTTSAPDTSVYGQRSGSVAESAGMSIIGRRRSFGCR